MVSHFELPDIVDLVDVATRTYLDGFGVESPRPRPGPDYQFRGVDVLDLARPGLDPDPLAPHVGAESWTTLAYVDLPSDYRTVAPRSTAYDDGIRLEARPGLEATKELGIACEDCSLSGKPTSNSESPSRKYFGHSGRTVHVESLRCRERARDVEFPVDLHTHGPAVARHGGYPRDIYLIALQVTLGVELTRSDDLPSVGSGSERTYPVDSKFSELKAG